MTHNRIAARLAAEAARQFDLDVLEGLAQEDEKERYIDDWVHDGLVEAEYQQAEEREALGCNDDTPCLQSADFWGTGEGAYHGVI